VSVVRSSTVPATPMGARAQAGGDAVVHVRGLSKSFVLQRSWRELLARPRDRRTQTALQDISLEVVRGEFFGLLGQNGAGKSTLFRILAGLVLPDAGDVDIVRSDGSESRDGGVALVVPSERSLYWRLSARENLRLYAALHDMDRREVTTRIEETLQVVGLADTDQKQVGLFSSGMRQRLLIARALLPRPDILLLDEPTRSLDPISARDFRRFLREEIGRRQGCTVLLATHDHEEVRDLCDRIGILHRGRLIAMGRTDEILGALEYQRIRLRVRDQAPTWLEPLLAERGGNLLEETDPDREGWRWIRIELADTSEPDFLLPELQLRGLHPSRIEREELGLADLLEKVSLTNVSAPGRAP